MKDRMFTVTRRTVMLAGALFVVLLVWVSFQRTLGHAIGVHVFLRTTNPREEAFYQLANQTADPVPFLNRCWATGKVTHRIMVAAFLNDRARAGAAWFAGAEPLVLAGARDADESVRELALAVLEARQNPQLFECAQALLDDVDPLMRLLGLDYVRKAEPQKAVPVVIRLLDDPDLRVVAGAEVALTRWSGQDYGVRTHLAIPPQPGAQPDPAKAETIREGVRRRKAWWQQHAQEYRSVLGHSGPADRQHEINRPAAADFTLTALDGTRFRLGTLRGKVVLLNFWATWCTACLAEIPDLIALQNNVGKEVAIIGVALDGVPHEHDEAHGQDPPHDSEDGESWKAVRAKVDQAVKARGINYAVLLDPSSSVGGQFNGGELPTTVILDAEGRVRRRLIGERSLEVFKAMVEEASRPR